MVLVKISLRITLMIKRLTDSDDDEEYENHDDDDSNDCYDDDCNDDGYGCRTSS